MPAQKDEKQELDAIDMAILSQLQNHGRATVKEIAERVHLSATPVHERIRRMERIGVIRGYTVIVNRAALGKGLMVICYVSLKQHNREVGAQFIEAIHQMTEVIECLTISGQFDFMLKVVVENMEAYYDFHVNRLSAVPNVTQVQSVFVMGVVKERGRLL